MKRLLALVRHYAASADPRVEAANWVALVLAWNAPFYPLYLMGAGGGPGVWLTAWCLPLFLAIPALARRHPFAGRVVLALAASGHTLFCTWVLGEASGTHLFLLPCVTLAALLFRRRERIALFSLLALPIVAGIMLDGRYAASPFACMGTVCAAILWLNAVSVAVLTAFLGLLATGLADSEVADSGVADSGVADAGLTATGAPPSATHQSRTRCSTGTDRQSIS